MGGLHSPPLERRSDQVPRAHEKKCPGTDLIRQRGGRTLNDAGLSILRVAMSCPRWSRGSGMNLATRWIDRGAVAFNVPTAFGAGSFPGGSERAPRALVEGHLEGRFVERAKVSRREAGLRADKRWGASTGVGMGAAQQRVAADKRTR